MRSWAEPYQIEQMLRERLEPLSDGQRRGLALWVCGTILARSGCQSAVVAALLVLGEWHALQ